MTTHAHYAGEFGAQKMTKKLEKDPAYRAARAEHYANEAQSASLQHAMSLQLGKKADAAEHALVAAHAEKRIKVHAAAVQKLAPGSEHATNALAAHESAKNSNTEIRLRESESKSVVHSVVHSAIHSAVHSESTTDAKSATKVAFALTKKASDNPTVKTQMAASKAHEHAAKLNIGDDKTVALHQRMTEHHRNRAETIPLDGTKTKSAPHDNAKLAHDKAKSAYEELKTKSDALNTKFDAALKNAKSQEEKLALNEKYKLDKKEALPKLLVALENIKITFAKTPAGIAQTEFKNMRNEFSKTLTDVEKSACLAYSKETYNTINKSLRTESVIPEKLSTQIHALDSTIDKSIMKHDIVVQRGIGADVYTHFSSMKPGDVYIEKAFTSTSAISNDGIAGAFQGSVQMRITIPKGGKAAPIPSEADHEYEMLLPRNQKFRVDRIEHGVYHDVKSITLHVTAIHD